MTIDALLDILRENGYDVFLSGYRLDHGPFAGSFTYQATLWDGQTRTKSGARKTITTVIRMPTPQEALVNVMRRSGLVV